MLDKVRLSCQEVADHAEKIRINYAGIADYARLLPVEQGISPTLDTNTHFLGSTEDTAAFFIILDSINFGSGYFPKLKKPPNMSGYFTVASSLTDYFRKNGVISPERLARLSMEDCIEIFNQDPENKDVRELMTLFSKALNDLGDYIIRDFHGSFLGLLEEAGNSAESLLSLLIKMPFFNDIGLYKNRTIHFYKRAQLTSADLSIAFKGYGPGYFNDLDKLTIFADNLVPHVLRIDGILIYDKDLEARIDNGELIPSRSMEEIEIRACAVHAVELIKKELHKSRYNVSSLGLDYLLWNRGQQPYYKKIRPRHRTRTVFY